MRYRRSRISKGDVEQTRLRALMALTLCPEFHVLMNGRIVCGGSSLYIPCLLNFFKLATSLARIPGKSIAPAITDASSRASIPSTFCPHSAFFPLSVPELTLRHFHAQQIAKLDLRYVVRDILLLSVSNRLLGKTGKKEV